MYTALHRIPGSCSRIGRIIYPTRLNGRESGSSASLCPLQPFLVDLPHTIRYGYDGSERRLRCLRTTRCPRGRAGGCGHGAAEWTRPRREVVHVVTQMQEPTTDVAEEVAMIEVTVDDVIVHALKDGDITWPGGSHQLGLVHIVDSSGTGSGHAAARQHLLCHSLGEGWGPCA